MTGPDFSDSILDLHVRDVGEERRHLIRAWLLSEEIDPVNCYRFRVQIEDCPMVTIYRHVRDADGVLQIDRATGKVLVAEPTVRAVRTLPPGWRA